MVKSNDLDKKKKLIKKKERVENIGWIYILMIYLFGNGTVEKKIVRETKKKSKKKMNEFAYIFVANERNLYSGQSINFE